MEGLATNANRGQVGRVVLVTGGGGDGTTAGIGSDNSVVCTVLSGLDEFLGDSLAVPAEHLDLVCRSVLLVGGVSHLSNREGRALVCVDSDVSQC